MNSTAELIRQARRDAGLTQHQLARRLSISQGAVAQLERAGANPTIATVERTLRAADHQLELRAVPVDHGIDITLLKEALRMTPAERIAASERLTRDAEKLAGAVARSRRR